MTQPENPPVEEGAPAGQAGVAPVVSEDAVRLAEALIFAATEPGSARRLADLLESRRLMPDGQDDLGAFVDAVLAALVQRYEGRGVSPVEVAGGWQFRTSPDLAAQLTPVPERPPRLVRSVMHLSLFHISHPLRPR